MSTCSYCRCSSRHGCDSDASRDQDKCQPRCSERKPSCEQCYYKKRPRCSCRRCKEVACNERCKPCSDDESECLQVCQKRDKYRICDEISKRLEIKNDNVIFITIN